jgi:hypothetical protein
MFAGNKLVLWAQQLPSKSCTVGWMTVGSFVRQSKCSFAIFVDSMTTTTVSSCGCSSLLKKGLNTSNLFANGSFFGCRQDVILTVKGCLQRFGQFQVLVLFTRHDDRCCSTRMVDIFGESRIISIVYSIAVFECRL